MTENVEMDLEDQNRQKSKSIEPPAAPEPAKLDRTKICPLLLRIFPRQGAHHRLTEYQERGQLPKGEIQVHTWMDADLKELSELVKEVHPGARHRNAKIEFALVFPDKRGRSIMRLVGEVSAEEPGPDDNKTLQQLKFQTGDFMDVAIRLPDNRERAAR